MLRTVIAGKRGEHGTVSLVPAPCSVGSSKRLWQNSELAALHKEPVQDWSSVKTCLGEKKEGRKGGRKVQAVLPRGAI